MAEGEGGTSKAAVVVVLGFVALWCVIAGAESCDKRGHIVSSVPTQRADAAAPVAVPAAQPPVKTETPAPTPGIGGTARIGDVDVCLLSVKVGWVETTEGKYNRGPWTQCRVRITNQSPVKRVTYHSWQGVHFFTSPALSDEHGNSLRRAPYWPAGERLPAVHSTKRYTDLNPGSDPIEDVLVFEPPLHVATRLKLELHGDQVQHYQGRAVFEFPLSQAQQLNQ